MAKSQFIHFFLFLALFPLFQCRQGGETQVFLSEPSVETDLAAIQKRGYLNALIDNNSVSYFIYKGTPMGYEYELLQHFAKHLKVKLKIKVISGVEEAIDQLNKGEGDVLAFPLTITKERTQYFSFSQPHYSTHQVLVQKKPANWRMQPPAVIEKR
ncbi:MAG: transporter substrate-binding domain-containing protein, partial [Cytophagales bacterium]